MSKASAYKNRGLNETITKFDIEKETEVVPETFIILDIFTPIKPHYSLVRSELFKNIIPSLDLGAVSQIHFIYNENNEAKYFYGNIKGFKNLYIQENSFLQKSDNNFLNICSKLKEVLNTKDKNNYINILAIVNYSNEFKEVRSFPLEETIKKFKYFYFQN